MRGSTHLTRFTPGAPVPPSSRARFMAVRSLPGNAALVRRLPFAFGGGAAEAKPGGPAAPR